MKQTTILMTIFIFLSLFSLSFVNATSNYTSRAHIGTGYFYEPEKIDEWASCSNSNEIYPIAIVVKQSIFKGIESEIKEYKSEIESKFNYQVRILKYDDNVTASKIKNDLSKLYRSGNLRGVILVGNIPTFKVGIHCKDYPHPIKPCLDYKSGNTSNNEGVFSPKHLDLSDLIYTDVDNLCEYNSITDAYYKDSPKCIIGSKNIKLPFWISRIYPHSSTGNDIKEIIKYFQSNLIYREGKVTFKAKHLVYAPTLGDTTVFPNKKMNIFDYYNHLITGAGVQALQPGQEGETDINKIDDSDTETYKKSEITFLDDSSNDEMFFKELEKNYETVYLDAHGEPTWHQKNVTPDFIRKYKPKTIFFRFRSCSLGRFIEKDYLVGRYLARGAFLFATAATTPASSSLINPYKDNFLLKQGAPIFQVLGATDRGAFSWFGDPTIRISNVKLDRNMPIARISKTKLDIGKILKGNSKDIELEIKNKGEKSLKIVKSITAKYDYGTRGGIASIYVSNSKPQAKGDVIVLNKNEIAKLTLKISSYRVGQISGNIYIATNDPEHYIIKIPFNGEVISSNSNICYNKNYPTITMTLKKAKEIALANKDCVKHGLEIDSANCNTNSGTWWFNLKYKTNTCSYACVVNVKNKSSKIYPMCGGLIMPIFNSGKKPHEIKVFTKNGSKTILIKKISNKETSIESGNVSAITSNKLKSKENKLYFETTNGNKLINVLPDQAFLKVKEKTKVSRVRQIELKQEKEKPIYEIKAEKPIKIVAIFPATMKIKTKVDARTGDIISVKKPWWSFLAW